MKRMKKFLSLTLVLLLALGLLAGCGSGSSATAPEGDLSTMIDNLYAKKDSGLAVQTIPIDLADAGLAKSFTGLDDVSKVKEAAASEAMIGAQAYSLVMVRLNDAADAESIATSMKSGIDPRKWICVEADDLRVAACGNLVMLVMVSSELAESVTAEQMVDAFKDLCGGTLTVDLK